MATELDRFCDYDTGTYARLHVVSDVRNKALIVGDAFQTRGGMAVSGQMKFWFPFPAMATWSKEISLQSAEKLREYEPSSLAAGHGKMINDPVAFIELAIKEAKRNIESKKEGN